MSRFVSAGTDPDSRPEVPSDDAWLKAKQQVESQKKPKTRDEGAQDGGKSLYEVLQQNKAAKQEAFEEAARLKNQFRALDDDEIEFLDSVAEASRAKEDAVRQETTEQLEAFRKQRALAEQALLEQATTEETSNLGDAVSKSAWTTQKKRRRRDKESDPGSGPKSRKLSSPVDDKIIISEKAKMKSSEEVPVQNTELEQPSINPVNEARKPTTAGLDLGYSTSEEED